MKQEMPDFIVIDDDPVNNKICSVIIHRLYPDKRIKNFTDPELALSYIEDIQVPADAGKVILLLDINMPVLSGWDVLDRLDTLDKSLLDRITIYILSSSVDIYDKKKADDNHLVSGYIEKPLSLERVTRFFDK